MDKKGYRITLSDEEKVFLEKIIDEGVLPQNTIMRARILLACHIKGSGNGVTLGEMAEDFGVSRTFIQNVRSEYKEGGFEYALYCERWHANTLASQKKADVLAENVKAMITERPPEGKKRWTVRLVASECVKRGYAEHASPAYVLKLLKKHDVTL